MAATQRGFTAAESEHHARLEAASAESAALIKKAQQRYDEERLRQENALVAREKRLAELEAAAAEAEAANEATRADLTRRLGLIAAASAA